MKLVIRSALLVGLIGLTACSSTAMLPERTQQVDQEYVNQVEALSRNRSHRLSVYWINPPVKKEQATNTLPH